MTCFIAWILFLVGTSLEVLTLCAILSQNLNKDNEGSVQYRIHDAGAMIALPIIGIGLIFASVALKYLAS